MMIGIYERAGLFDKENMALDLIDSMMGSLFKGNEKGKAET